LATPLHRVYKTVYFLISNVVEKCNHQDQGIEDHNSIDPTGGTPRQLSDCSWCGNSTNPSRVHAPLSSRRRTGTPRGSGTELGSQRHWLFPLSPVGHRHHRDSQEQNNRRTQWSHRHIRQDQGSCHRSGSGILALQALVLAPCHAPMAGRGYYDEVVVGDTREFLHHGTHGWSPSHSQCISGSGPSVRAPPLHSGTRSCTRGGSGRLPGSLRGGRYALYALSERQGHHR